MNTVLPIADQWKTEQKVFEKNLSVLKERLNTDAIHDLRVAIKKLRAYLELYTELRKEKELSAGWQQELLTETDNLFNVSGRQRDVEICLSLLAAFKNEKQYSFSHLQLFLQTVLKITKAWTNEAIHHYSNKEIRKIYFLFKQETNSVKPEEFGHAMQTIINNRLIEIKNSFSQPHKLRKSLKSVYYCLCFFKDDDYHAGLLHDILDDLGNWQDHEVLAARIKHFRRDYLPKPIDEYETLKELEKKIKEKKKFLIKEVRNKTRNWLKIINIK